MELNYNTISLLDTVAIIQGLTLGTLLILLNRKKYKPTFFLGIFVFMFSIEKIPMVLTDLGFWPYYPELYLMPLNHTWLLFPLFYIYIQKVSIFCDEKVNYLLLIPGMAVFVMQTILFFLPYEQRLLVEEMLWYILVFSIGNGYALFIAYKALVYIEAHMSAVKQHFSSLHYKELKWARTFTFLGILYYMSGLVLLFLPVTPNEIKVLFTLANFTIIYWISFHGTLQFNVESILSNLDEYGLSLKPEIAKKENANLGTMTDSDMEALVMDIDQHMMHSEIFLHTELTLLDLANALDVHPRKISTAINKVRKQNFNTYINRFRIKKAMQLLDSKMAASLSVEGLGHEVGFHSKSAFYQAFKKETGITPTRYRATVLQ